MCKNWKYSKGTAFGVLVKNIKYVPQFEGHLIYVPHVPQIEGHLRDMRDEKKSSTFCPKIQFSRGYKLLFSVFNRWGNGLNEKSVKKHEKLMKIDEKHITRHILKRNCGNDI